MIVQIALTLRTEARVSDEHSLNKGRELLLHHALFTLSVSALRALLHSMIAINPQ